MNNRNIPQKQLHRFNRHQVKGFMLIETLVAVIILAIGLLGMASMQVVGLKNNNSAYTRTQATYLAYDIIDRIRNNPNADYSLAMGSVPADVGATAAEDLCSFDNATSTLNCDENDLMVFDQATWIIDIADVLPSGVGGIAVNGNSYTISIRWIDKQAVATVDQQVTFQMSVVI